MVNHVPIIQAVAAGDPLRELMSMRRAYDAELQSSLGPSGYQEYKAYELAKPVERTIDAMARELPSFDLTSVERAHLVTVLVRANGATVETWDGPFDPLPRPAVGREAVAPRLLEEVSRWRAAKTAVETDTMGVLSENTVTAVTSYYDGRIRAHEKHVEQLINAQPMSEADGLRAMGEAMEADRLGK